LEQPEQVTEAQKKALKAKTDIAQVFLVFMSLVGDVPKTAAAVDLDPEFVQWLADTEGWTAKIKRVSMMSKSEKPGDFERAVNRALAFAQAQRMRLLLDGALSEAHKMKSAELLAKTSTSDKAGRARWSGKFFLDMASAIETVTRVSLVALGDTVTERVEREDTGGDVSASSLHQSILNALNNPAAAKAAINLIGPEQAQAVQLLSDKSETLRETVEAERAEQDVPKAPSENPDQSSRDSRGLAS
jgi:hypothetical protein